MRSMRAAIKEFNKQLYLYDVWKRFWRFYIMSNAAQRNKPFKPPYWYINLSAIVTTAAIIFELLLYYEKYCKAILILEK